MRTLKGIAVSAGIAIGAAMVIDNEGFRIRNASIRPEAVDAELERFRNSIAIAHDELKANRDAVTAELGEQYGDIFLAHLRILEEPTLIKEIETAISKLAPVEHAVRTVLKGYADRFSALPDVSMAKMSNDIVDLEKRLLRILTGIHQVSMSDMNQDVVILAHNLTPSDTTNMSRTFVKGFVTEIGSTGSHTAIVAEALEIPAVVGMGSFLKDVQSGQKVIIDGYRGAVILDPDEETLLLYKQRLQKCLQDRIEMAKLDYQQSVTLDGTRITLNGNIEFSFEAKLCNERGADGIGLFRTEFLYLKNKLSLNEEEHYEEYSYVIDTMKGKPVTIRTFDLGSDKIQTDLMPGMCHNPALGLRSIRLALHMPELLRNQLRAIFRASAHGPVQILFPMISTLSEWRRVKMIINDTKEDLDDRKIDYDPNIPLGIMVEVPSVVMLIEEYLKDVNFISIGTNDLIQYTLAADRTNMDVSHLFMASDPAIIRMIKIVLDAVKRTNESRNSNVDGCDGNGSDVNSSEKKVSVSLCGQMAGDPVYTQLLLGLGLRNFSVPPVAMADIKKVCRSVCLDECRDLAERVMNIESARAIRSALIVELAKYLPERYRFGDDI